MIKAYAFDYRRYWGGKRRAAIAQLDSSKSRWHPGPYGLQLSSARLGYPPVCSCIQPQGVVGTNGFDHHYSMVYYPGGIRGMVVSPARLVSIGVANAEEEEDEDGA